MAWWLWRGTNKGGVVNEPDDWVVRISFADGHAMVITQRGRREDTEKTYLEIRKARREGKDFEFETVDGGRRLIDTRAITDMCMFRQPIYDDD